MISTGTMLLIAIPLGVLAWMIGRGRARQVSAASGERLHSLPSQHGAFVAVAALTPAVLLVVFWMIFGDSLIAREVLANIPADSRPATELDRSSFLSEVEGLVSGTYARAFSPLAEQGARDWVVIEQRYSMLVGSAALALALLGGLWGWTRIRPSFRARTRVENIVMLVLIVASLVAILTTFGIVASLIFESMRFFSKVSPIEFLFGTHWAPESGTYGSGSFGAVPLFWGTVFIGAIIAMIVAIPLGLMTAIYLTQYAAPSFRGIAKPVLEVLAGVPTVVYGFFAALVVAPAVRDFAISIGIPNASSESALAAGLVMGIMIIPFISSMADDALAAVPGAMRDGSYAMGATRSETIRRVLIPAALPGIVGGVLLAVSRAIGETMIVVMAAGLAARLTANPFDSVTTVTVQIVGLLTGDQEFDSAKTQSAFALGLVLFLVTLALNVYALAIVKKYREAYD
ncbi:MAG: phosphate ABC transporter permease subunit PstC [Sphingomonadaceae bacterium]